MKRKYNRWLARRFPTGKVPLIFRILPLFSNELLIIFRITCAFERITEALKNFSVNSEGAQKAIEERLKQYAELHEKDEVRTNETN